MEGKVYYWYMVMNVMMYDCLIEMMKVENKFGYFGYFGASFTYLGVDDLYGVEEYNVLLFDVYS